MQSFCAQWPDGDTWTGMNKSAQITVIRDEIADRINELADLCETWSRHRGNSYKPVHIRSAILSACDELVAMKQVLNISVIERRNYCNGKILVNGERYAVWDDIDDHGKITRSFSHFDKQGYFVDVGGDRWLHCEEIGDY